MDFSNNSSWLNLRQRSSSLTIGERICVAFIPFIGMVEALIFAVTDCFELGRPRVWRNGCVRKDFARLSHESRFSVNELEKLYELFKKLGSSIIDDGFIHKEELQLALFQTPYGENLFVDRVFDLFDEKKNGVIEFEEFVHALNVFHPYTPLEEKIDCKPSSRKCLLIFHILNCNCEQSSYLFSIYIIYCWLAVAFRLYDLRQTGFIEREEVKQMLIAILMESDVNLPDNLVDDIIDRTFAVVDADMDGKINKEDWRAFAVKNPSLLRNMTLPYLNFSEVQNCFVEPNAAFGIGGSHPCQRIHLSLLENGWKDAILILRSKNKVVAKHKI